MFSKLTANTRGVLEKRFADLSERGIAFYEMKLESVLLRMKEFFWKTRYGYELETRMPSDGVVRGTYGLWNAATAARTVILDQKPDWDEMYQKRSSIL